MRVIYLVSAILLVAACAGQPPSTTSYLLRSAVDPDSGTQLQDSGIALGTVRVAIYIEQPGLVLARGDGKVQAANYHVWAEPLQVSLRRFLATEISSRAGRHIGASAAPSAAARIDVLIDQLHGTAEGTALLVAYWQVVSAERSAEFSFAQQQPLADDGYDALVQAEQALLQQLAGAIAGSLNLSDEP